MMLYLQREAHAISPLAETKLNDPVKEGGQRTPKKQGDARTDSKILVMS